MSQPRKPIRKPRNVIIYVGSLLFALVAVFFLFNIGKQYVTVRNLSSSLEAVQKELAQLKEENEQLEAQREKLSDPEYVKNYARGQYMLSEEDEQIFRLPKNNR